MSNKKISALTSAAVPLAGTEVIPLVQSGATVKVAVSNLTAGRSIQALDLTTSGAGLALTGRYDATYPTVGVGYFQLVTNNSDQSNGGMTVKTNLSGTMTDAVAFKEDGNVYVLRAAKGINFTANTPAAGMTSQLLNWYEEGTWTPAGNGVTFSSATGKYTRTGNLVTATFAVTFPTTADTNNAQISGLPFTVGAASGVALNGNLTITQLSPNVGATSLSFLTANNAAYSTNANLSTQPYTGSVSYQI